VGGGGGGTRLGCGTKSDAQDGLSGPKRASEEGKEPPRKPKLKGGGHGSINALGRWWDLPSGGKDVSITTKCGKKVGVTGGTIAQHQEANKKREALSTLSPLSNPRPGRSDPGGGV